MAQAAENVELGEAHAGLDFCLILRPTRSGWKNADRVVGRHLAVAAVDLGIVERGLVDAALQVVRDDELGHAAMEAEHAHMGFDPIRQGLGPGRFGIGQVGGAEYGDEDLGVADLAGERIDDRQLLAGVIDEDLVAGDVMLAHGRRQAALEGAKQIAEARVAVSVRMVREIFLVQDGDADARPLELLDQVGPIRLRPAARADPGARPGEQLLLEGSVGQVLRQGPDQPGRLGPLDGVPHGRARRADNPADCAVAGSTRVEP